jgi:hypothetical protein
MEYRVHEEFPPVMHLAIHLPGEQPFYFMDDDDEESLLEKMNNARSTLMAFFEYNSKYENGRQYLYQDFPTNFVFNSKERSWTLRKRGMSIGRIYHCSPF